MHILSDKEIEGIDEIGSIIDEFMSRESGTIILWRKLDRLDNFDESGMGEKKLNSLINEARKHIELTFHRFLSSSRGKKSLRISINGDFLEAFNPFNPSNLATRELPEQKIYLHNEQITYSPMYYRITIRYLLKNMKNMRVMPVIFRIRDFMFIATVA